MANGIGGDLFAIVYEAKSGKLYGLNASGWAPAALTPEFLKGKGISQMPQTGIHSVTVPGVVDGWAKLLERFGRKRLPDVLAPAISYAEQGFPVTEIFSSYWVDCERKLRQDPTPPPPSSRRAAPRSRESSSATLTWPGRTNNWPPMAGRPFMKAQLRHGFSPAPEPTAER